VRWPGPRRLSAGRASLCPSTHAMPTSFALRPAHRSPPSGPELAGIADEDLMVRIHSGDAAAFELVFDRHSDAAFSLAYRMCGRRATAEDIVQEAFLSLWRSGARYDGTRGTVRSWVLGVVHHRAVDLFRKDSARTGRDVSDDEALERRAAPEDTACDAGRLDEAAAIRTALRDIPDDQRHVIILAYFGGYTHSEIAAMLQVPAGTVKGRMRLGMRKLRLSLGALAGSTS
jgi:RNA polymerase sigma-70 factor (ECF subfamily)